MSEKIEFDWLWSERYEQGFQSVDDYIDHCEGQGDEPEDELFLCDNIALQLSHHNVIDKMVEDMSESDEFYIDGWDWSEYFDRLEGLDELRASFETLIKEFNAKQRKTIYQTNGKKVKYEYLIKD